MRDPLHDAPPPPVQIPLTVLPEKPCPYLPNRLETIRAVSVAGRCDPNLYHEFMDANFRRSGRMLYQPVCRECRACRQIRVVVAKFLPSKSQRRCAKRNVDLNVEIAPPVATEEKFDLYLRYQAIRHKRDTNEENRAGFEGFLYDSPVDSLEFLYRDAAGKLLAVGICDVCDLSLSSVYFYYDPEEANRGLGTFGALKEIEAAGKLNISHYYLGYWVSGAKTMEYKATFRPCEILTPDGNWTDLRP